MKKLVLLALVAGACTPALADDVGTVTLFGRKFNVQRFDYNAILVPNARPNLVPPDPNYQAEFGLTSVEGTHVLSPSKLLLSSRQMASTRFGPSTTTAQSYVVRYTLRNNPLTGKLESIDYDKTIAVNGTGGGYVSPSRMATRGITVNTGSTGLGAGGNLVSIGRFDPNNLLRAFAIDPASPFNTDILYTPTDPGSVPASATPTAGYGFSTNPPNNNIEDVAYVPVNDRFYTIRQDNIFADSQRIDIFKTTGGHVAEFQIGFGTTGFPLDGNPGQAKGIAFAAEGPQLPLSLQGEGGIILVGLDDVGPGVEAFDLDGNLIKHENLANNIETDPFLPPIFQSILDLGGCGAILAPLPNPRPERPLQIESLGYDACSGRFFFTNQSDTNPVNTCPYIFVLTPACPADFNQDGTVDNTDFVLFANAYNDFLTCNGDLNYDEATDNTDFVIFANAYNEFLCP